MSARYFNTTYLTQFYRLLTSTLSCMSHVLIIDDVHIIEKLTSPCGSNSASESTSDHSDGDGDWVDVYITTAIAGRSQRNSHEGSGLCDRP